MGKKGKNPASGSVSAARNSNLTLRQESSGKKPLKVVPKTSKAMLKLKHLQNMATWASAEASIPSLGAFFGHQFATYGETIDAPPDPSLLQCQRCETILQPGFNCTVRIEKNKAKTRRRCGKPNNSPKNNVVYKCHCCSHWNIKRGTPKDHMKRLCPPKAKSKRVPVSDPEKVKPLHENDLGKAPTTPTIDLLEGKSSSILDPQNVTSALATEPVTVIIPTSIIDSENAKSTPSIYPQNIASALVTDSEKVLEIKDEAILRDERTPAETPSVTAPIDSPATPMVTARLTLLDQKKRKRSKSASKKPPESDESSAKVDGANIISASSKKRKKGWTSLKEIAEKSDQHYNNKKVANLTIPFFL